MLTPSQTNFWTSSKKNWADKKNGIGATIRIGGEIQCLMYAGFFRQFFVLWNWIDVSPAMVRMLIFQEIVDGN